MYYTQRMDMDSCTSHASLLYQSQIVDGESRPPKFLFDSYCYLFHGQLLGNSKGNSTEMDRLMLLYLLFAIKIDDP